MLKEWRKDGFISTEQEEGVDAAANMFVFIREVFANESDHRVRLSQEDQVQSMIFAEVVHFSSYRHCPFTVHPILCLSLLVY
jgi:hypothetical protein